MEKDLEMMKNPNYQGPEFQVNNQELGSDGSVEDVIIKVSLEIYFQDMRMMIIW